MSVPLRENPLDPVRGPTGVVTPLTPSRPARSWCPERGKPRPAWLPPEKFCCRQDHYLQGTYGITCDDYWRLHAEQEHRCAVCGQPPSKSRRLVVDHDHDTGSIDGLCHFGCNRRLHSNLRRYLADPPGQRLGLEVTPAKLKEIRRVDRDKRVRERRRRELRRQPGPVGDFQARNQAALEQTRQER